jgi:septal ring factor EnvC (AmiA/AmiB activator)
MNKKKVVILFSCLIVVAVCAVTFFLKSKSTNAISNSNIAGSSDITKVDNRLNIRHDQLTKEYNINYKKRAQVNSSITDIKNQIVDSKKQLDKTKTGYNKNKINNKIQKLNVKLNNSQKELKMVSKSLDNLNIQIDNLEKNNMLKIGICRTGAQQCIISH